MDKKTDPEELERQLEQATRLASMVGDQTTLQRIRDFIAELKQSLERRRARRRSQEEIRARARHLWEQAGRPEDRSEEFWLQAEREIMQQRNDV
jgi:hypothetical protein